MSSAPDRDWYTLLGFMLAYKIMAEVHNIALPPRELYEDERVKELLREIAAGRTTLIDRPDMPLSLQENKITAQSVLDELRRLNREEI